MLVEYSVYSMAVKQAEWKVSQSASSMGIYLGRHLAEKKGVLTDDLSAGEMADQLVVEKVYCEAA